MRNPYEAEPAEEPRVCATCARYFDFDRMCNVPEAVEKLLRERFGIVLGGSEFAVEPEKITDCAAWVSARLIDRYALLRAKQDGKAAARAASAPGCRIGLRTGTPLSSGRAPCAVRAAGRRAAYGRARPCQGKRGPFHVEDRSRSEIPAPFHAGPTARTVRHSPTRRRRWTACRSSRHAPRRAFIRAKGGTVFPPAADAPRRAYRTHNKKSPRRLSLGFFMSLWLRGQDLNLRPTMLLHPASCGKSPTLTMREWQAFFRPVAKKSRPAAVRPARTPSRAFPTGLPYKAFLQLRRLSRFRRTGRDRSLQASGAAAPAFRAGMPTP